MTNQEIRQLAVWLKETHLAGAEIRRPGLHLVLKRCVDEVAEPVQITAPEALKAPDEQLLKTPGLGRLLLTHPQQSEVLVSVAVGWSQGNWSRCCKSAICCCRFAARRPDGWRRC
ncbi:hypothetical protein [Pseudomonas cyclaminis]|uniref:hypothetical protein n=1 Tax=Pseudomonas cyclaminis TaxID=2781239 RepID=UPI001FE90427|nr:hypothetical protein [Pseudomonas cyclaminis]